MFKGRPAAAAPWALVCARAEASAIGSPGMRGDSVAIHTAIAPPINRERDRGARVTNRIGSAFLKSGE